MQSFRSCRRLEDLDAVVPVDVENVEIQTFRSCQRCKLKWRRSGRVDGWNLRCSHSGRVDDWIVNVQVLRTCWSSLVSKPPVVIMTDSITGKV